MYFASDEGSDEIRYEVCCCIFRVDTDALSLLISFGTSFIVAPAVGLFCRFLPASITSSCLSSKLAFFFFVLVAGST